MTVRHGGEQRRTEQIAREEKKECYSSHCAGINMAEKYIWRHSYPKKCVIFFFLSRLVVKKFCPKIKIKVDKQKRIVWSKSLTKYIKFL
jgi:hypothetical protein